MLEFKQSLFYLIMAPKGKLGETGDWDVPQSSHGALPLIETSGPAGETSSSGAGCTDWVPGQGAEIHLPRDQKAKT